MPHAIERSVATPTMNARLPERNPMPEPADGEEAGSLDESGQAVRGGYSAAGRHPNGELLTRQDVARAHAVPGLNLRHAHLEEPRDPPQRIAEADRVDHAARAAVRMIGSFVVLRMAAMMPVIARRNGCARDQAQPLSRV